MKHTLTTGRNAPYRLRAATRTQTEATRSLAAKTLVHDAQTKGRPFSTWALLASLYMTQFMGMSFFMIALVVIMRRQGMPLERLGGIYLLGLFWVAKLKNKKPSREPDEKIH